MQCIRKMATCLVSFSTSALTIPREKNKQKPYNTPNSIYFKSLNSPLASELSYVP